MLENYRPQPNTTEQPNFFLERAYEMAVDAIEKDEIKMESFLDVLGEEKVRGDIEYIREMKSRFDRGLTLEDREQKKKALILEAIVNEQIEKGDWLGPNALTRKASAYDDFKHGVDTIVEIKKEDDEQTYLALAIDVTHGLMLANKLSGIRHEIETGELTMVEYLETSDGNKHKLQSGIPRVVLGVDDKSLGDLIVLWVNNDNKALGKHPVQKLFLEEIYVQLKTYYAYAKKIGNENAATLYMAQIEIVEDIKRQKEEIDVDEQESDDKVFHAILSQMNTFGVERNNTLDANDRHDRVDKGGRASIARLRRMM
jgi:hypothetical protein